MALAGYGVLVGPVVGRKAERDQQTPHYQVQVAAATTDFRIAVNVRSAANPPDLLYIADEDFAHPILGGLTGLADGFHSLPSRPGGSALDYIRGNLFDRTAMRTLPANAVGPDNDLSDKFEHFLARAQQEPGARVFAFGQRWGPEAGKKDKVFGFDPGNGVHDIHMNQGNSGKFRGDDGVWQDGGLIIHFPGSQQWVAFFLAFQSQAWHTDDTTGHTIAAIERPGPAPKPAPGEPDHKVRIVAALVNPVGPEPEAETVTLVNASPQPVNLGGWAIADRMKNQFKLPAQTLAGGAALQVALGPPVALGNQGGLITLLDSTGLKVDGVAYTKGQAREGWTVVF